MNQPVGYRDQSFPCCATCQFCTILGGCDDAQVIYACETHGEPSDGDYYAIKTNPIGICDVWKQNPLKIKED